MRAVFAYSRQGYATACKIRDFLEGTKVYVTKNHCLPEETPIPELSGDFYEELFHTCKALVFVGACGIAVRKIAPFVRSKQKDPAVIVVDEMGHFVIPILSGHLGGANGLARVLADRLGAVPVVTTATDIHGKFSVDDWAARHHCALSHMAGAKAVSARILEQNVPICSDFPMENPLPDGLVLGDTGDLGICISFKEKTPFEDTLGLIPRILHLGIGCRRDTPEEQIAQAVEQVLKEHHIREQAIKCAASIDLKQNEQGLLSFCAHRGLPISFYSAEALAKVPGSFSHSEFVGKITGVDNVCERAACMGSARLVVKKTVCCGVTVAVAEENWEVHFG